MSSNDLILRDDFKIFVPLNLTVVYIVPKIEEDEIRQGL